MWIKVGKSAFTGWLVLTLSLAVVAAPNATAQLVQTDIGNLGGGNAAVRGVANGFVTGGSTIPGGKMHAYLWSATTGTMRDLGVLDGTDSSNGFNVNSSGEVVGLSSFFDYNTYAYTAHAFYWSAATGMIRINSISNAGYNGPNLVINDAGVVAGVDAGGNVYRWTLAGGIQNLGQACTDQTLVTAINARGDIIGNSGNPGFPDASVCAFFASGSSNTLSLLTSPGLSSPPTNLGYTENAGQVNIAANGLNDSGVVVGTYYDYGVIYYGYAVPLGGFYSAWLHNSHAFMWTSDGGFVELPGFPGAQDPYQPAVFRTNSSANAVSNAGQIVGTSNGPAFLYDTITSQLTQLGSLFSYDPSGVGTGLNDDGVIVGTSGSYWGSYVRPAMWQSGMPTDLTPSFAPYSGAPLIKGSTIAGSGYTNDYSSSRAWVLGLAPAQPPVDCVVSAFSEFSACSASCGGGTQTRTRTVLVEPANGGAACPALSDTQSCNTQPCPIDCVVASLGFGVCSASCGGGTQTEILEILTAPANGGAACRDPITQACNTHSCDTDGDGVPDTGDSCTGTAAGALVDAFGCSGAQLVALACPSNGTYKNHGTYVSCVAKEAKKALKQGLITKREKKALVKAAAHSSIGKRDKEGRDDDHGHDNDDDDDRDDDR